MLGEAAARDTATGLACLPSALAGVCGRPCSSGSGQRLHRAGAASGEPREHLDAVPDGRARGRRGLRSRAGRLCLGRRVPDVRLVLHRAAPPLHRLRSRGVGLAAAVPDDRDRHRPARGRAAPTRPRGASNASARRSSCTTWSAWWASRTWRMPCGPWPNACGRSSAWRGWRSRLCRHRAVLSASPPAKTRRCGRSRLARSPPRMSSTPGRGHSRHQPATPGRWVRLVPTAPRGRSSTAVLRDRVHLVPVRPMIDGSERSC